MKFKVLKGTELFKKFEDLQKEIQRCNKAAFALIEELGYKELRGANMVVAGGISSIIVPGGKCPENWRKSYSDVNGEFMPAKRKVNKDLLARIEALPVVEYGVFKKLIKYDYHDHDTNRMSFCPVINWKKNYVLIGIGEQYPRYKPVPDMIEITTSEYNKLLAGK